ncbi:hypothetical protein ZWY2020_058983 [Hordeum vulgare]|nr:hypothetical protein ZWY2020_058983 [Hordeum vulgare]
MSRRPQKSPHLSLSHHRHRLHPSPRHLHTSPPMALLCLHLLRPPHPPLAAVSSPWRRAHPATRHAARPASRLLCSNRHTAPSSASPSIVGVLLDYLNESWTQFHTSIEAKRQLLAAGLELLSENDDWNL